MLGTLLWFETAFMAVCALMAVGYGEDGSVAFLLSVLVTAAGSVVLRAAGIQSGGSISRREAYLLVSLAWVMFSAFGMLPYLFFGVLPDLTDAFFESMSGFTTTGATLIDRVELLPHSLLFWRSLTQWIGGLGIVFFTIALLPSMTGGSVRVFAAEATGPMRSRIHPKLSTGAKWIWSIYLLLTMLCGLCFWLCGMSVFDAACYSMSTTATGGFTPQDDGLTSFHSPMMEYVSTGFMFLSGINFTLLYMAMFRRHLSALLHSEEFHFYLGAIMLPAAIVATVLVSSCGYDVEHAVRSALFHVVSMLTTTGVFTEDIGTWPYITWLLLALCGVMGASGGSTTGGLKSMRCLMLVKQIRSELHRMLHPNAILPVRIDGQPVSRDKLSQLSTFFTLNIMMLLIATAVMVLSDIDLVNSVQIAISLVANVGAPLSSDVGPSMSWASLPDGTKWLATGLMLMGRLEIMTLMVIFTREFWRVR